MSLPRYGDRQTGWPENPYSLCTTTTTTTIGDSKNREKSDIRGKTKIIKGLPPFCHEDFSSTVNKIRLPWSGFLPLCLCLSVCLSLALTLFFLCRKEGKKEGKLDWFWYMNVTTTMMGKRWVITIAQVLIFVLPLLTVPTPLSTLPPTASVYHFTNTTTTITTVTTTTIITITTSTIIINNTTTTTNNNSNNTSFFIRYTASVLGWLDFSVDHRKRKESKNNI